jgi:hypothetical protein
MNPAVTSGSGRPSREPLALSLSAVPFSRRGCWLNLAEPRRPSEQPLGPGLYLRSSRARGASPQREHFRLELLRAGEVVPHRVEATTASVVLAPADGSVGRVELVLEGEATLRARGEGVGLRFTCTFPSPRAPATPAFACVTSRAGIEVNLRAALRRYHFAALRGGVASRTVSRGEVRAPVLEAGGEGGPWELAVDECGSAWTERVRRPFAEVRAQGVRQFEAFCRPLPPVPAAWARARRLAAFLLWSCTKSPSGFFRREPVLMSLNWMDGVWSWDNVFNAVALAGADPVLAYDQLRLMIDNQDELGAYPDRVDELVRHYNFSKPPVHGVLLQELERLHPTWWTPARTRSLVDSVARSTNWWLTHRVGAGRSLAHYRHGNDSGWDNSTLFLRGTPLEAPDLNALLAVQAGWLARRLHRLGRKRAAAHWRAVDRRLTRDLLAQLWCDGQFIGRTLPGNEEVRARSLVDCMPVLLGRRLPPAVARSLVRRIRTFVAPVGVASEQPGSPHYEADGYWRGPVWGASTYLIVLGLESLGQRRLARTLARRFCANCVRNGFAENFEALSGAALRDPGYTWTAGIFLLLAARIGWSRR